MCCSCTFHRCSLLTKLPTISWQIRNPPSRSTMVTFSWKKKNLNMQSQAHLSSFDICPYFKYSVWICDSTIARKKSYVRDVGSMGLINPLNYNITSISFDQSPSNNLSHSWFLSKVCRNTPHRSTESISLSRHREFSSLLVSKKNVNQVNGLSSRVLLQGKYTEIRLGEIAADCKRWSVYSNWTQWREKN